MAASLHPHTDLAPAEFSPTPELVRVAMVVLAVAGVAGLWKGAAEAMQQGRLNVPPPVSTATPAVAALPTVGATADTLLPPQSLGPAATPAPAPAKAALRPEPAAPEPGSDAPAVTPVVVESAPAAAPAVQPAPAVSAEEQDYAPEDDFEPAPPDEEYYPPD